MPTIPELAQAAGCSESTFRRWRRAGAPMPGDGEDLAAWSDRLRKWADEQPTPQRDRVAARGKPKPERPLDALERNRLAHAQLRELELAQRRGELVERSAMVAEWTRRVFAARTRLLALPRTLAGRCANAPPEVVEAEASALVRDLLLELAEDGELTPGGAAAAKV